MQINDKAYDILKWVAQVVLPALAAFYCAIAAIWGLPYAEQIVGTITACDALLGALLGISNINYKKVNAGVSGTLMVDQNNNNAILTQIQFDTPVENIVDKKTVVLKVDKDAMLTA